MYNQRMKFALPLTLAALLFAAPAFAANGDVQACGDTYKAKLDTDPENHFCDIYSRQFAYREEALKFKKMLKERQDNFDAPAAQARKTYQANMDALNASRTDDADGNE